MKTPAFTIVESMMALIVIMISFTAGMTLYLNLLKGDAFPLKTKVNTILNNVLIETKEEQRFLDESLTIDGLLIEKTVQPYKVYEGILQQQNVYQINLKVFTPNQALFTEANHLIHLDYEH